ncbi:hypothetical protein [Microcoleus sp. Pol14C4]
MANDNKGTQNLPQPKFSTKTALVEIADTALPDVMRYSSSN